MKKIKIKWTELLIFIVSAELVGALSALLAGDFGSFYSQLIQPHLSPPGWVFPVVWAILYGLMGISAYIVSESESPVRSAALGAYVIQLAVNFSWSIIFFRFKFLNTAAVAAVVLAVLVAFMICLFRKISKKAAYINVPYMVWSLFAAYLAIGTAFLN